MRRADRNIGNEKKYWYNKRDLNDDGYIAKWEKAAQRRMRKNSDKNGDGKLNWRERQQYRQKMRRADRNIGNEKKNWYRRRDLNDDGRVGKWERRVNRRVRKYSDKNGDGKLHGKKEKDIEEECVE